MNHYYSAHTIQKNLMFINKKTKATRILYYQHEKKKQKDPFCT